jgi:hypothetical protein
VREGVSGARLAPRVDLQQFGSDVADLLLRLAPRARPLIADEAVQCHGVGIDAGVAADHVERGHRHEQLGRLGVFDAQELGALAVDLERLQPEVAPDSVLEVHHGRSDVELGKVPDRALGGVAGARAPTALPHALAEQRRVRDHEAGRLVEPETLGDRRDRDRAGRVAAQEVVPAAHGRGLHPGAREQFDQHLAPTGSAQNSLRRARRPAIAAMCATDRRACRPRARAAVRARQDAPALGCGRRELDAVWRFGQRAVHRAAGTPAGSAAGRVMSERGCGSAFTASHTWSIPARAASR